MSYDPNIILPSQCCVPIAISYLFFQSQVVSLGTSGYVQWYLLTAVHA